MEYTLQAVGDAALKVQFPGDVSPELNAEIQFFCEKVKDAAVYGVVEWVPAFDSVTIYYKPHQISYQELCEKVKSIAALEGSEGLAAGSRLVSVPVLYGGEYGPDLKRVAEYNGISVEEVIEMHQQLKYLVYMLGFLPGFPYLGGLREEIATPRLDEPRGTTFAGAVGIAQDQTGIYPVESPGGWNIIGKTPLALFNQDAGEDAFLFRSGDNVRFYRVSDDAFREMEGDVAAGRYAVEISPMNEID